MQVILLEKIGKLGVLGDTVTVRAGYARNFLLPQGKATIASAANLEAFEQRRAELEQQAADSLSAAQARADKLAEYTLTIRAKAGSEGKLFGSIGSVDITEALAQDGHEVAKKEVRLPTGNLRDIGEYQVELHLHPDVNVPLAVVVLPEA